jgi:hypothetical protein
MHPKRAAISFAVLGTTIAMLIGVPARANASTPEYGPWLFWNSPTAQQNFVALSQRFTPENLAPTIFWSTQWFWNGSPDGGYAGIQTDGIRADGSVGPMAIFSVWDATKADAGANAKCIPFHEDGSGLSCRAPFNVVAGDTYRTDVAATRTDASGRWWHGSVTDETTGATIDLGEMAVPVTATAYEPATFVEYFGPTVACGQEPIVTTSVNAPLVTPAGTATPLPSTYQQATPRSCARAQVTPTASGATMIFGGPQPWTVPNFSVSLAAGVPTAHWGAASSDGGTPITGYSVGYSHNGGLTWTDGADVDATARAATFSLPAPGNYAFRVAAVNAAGTGAWATTDPVLADAGPVATITAPTTAITGAAQFSVAWHASSAAAVTGYTIQRASSRGGAPLSGWTLWKSKTTATSARVNATPGHTYCFRAQATDTFGITSPWSAPACTAVPLGALQMSAHGSWQRVPPAGWFSMTGRQTSTAGASLTSTGVVGTSVTLVVTRCPTCGSITVRWNGNDVATVDTSSPTVQRDQLLRVTVPALTKGTTLALVANVGAGQSVIIEGFAATTP